MLQTLWDGLVQGALYAVVALGYTMVYGILLLINFAHGDVVMIGAYTGVVTLAGLAGAGAFAAMGFVPCIVLATFSAIVVCAAWGVTIERVVYRPLRGAPSLSPLIGAIGVSMVLQNYVRLAQGSTPIYVPDAARATQAPWTIIPGSLSCAPLDVVIVCVCALVLYGLWTFVQRTRMGKAMRATSQDRVMAGLVGIDVARVVAVTFGVGSALAAVAGVLLPFYGGNQAVFDMGFGVGMKAFTAAVLGGIGNLPGAMLGGVVLGLVESLGRRYLSDQYKDVYAFVLLLVVLVVRPRGILGERVAEKV